MLPPVYFALVNAGVLADALKPHHALRHIVKLPAVQLITMNCGRQRLMDDRLSRGKRER